MYNLLLKRMLKRKEVAKLFGVHVNTIDRWVKEGHLKCVKYGNMQSTIRFEYNHVKEVLKNGFN